MAVEAARIVQRCDDAKVTKELMFNECGLKKFPDAVFLLLSGVDIVRVSLANNQFPKLPSRVPVSPVFAAVTSFDMSRNTLSALPDSFSSLQHLSEVNLSGNQFETFPSVLTHMPSLTHIALCSNRLRTLSEQTLERLPQQLLLLDLTGNPLTDDTKALLVRDQRARY